LASVFLCGDDDSKDKIATCRWHVAATSSKTGGYNDFAPPFMGQNANEPRHPLHKKQTPFGVCFLSVSKNLLARQRPRLPCVKGAGFFRRRRKKTEGLMQ